MNRSGSGSNRRPPIPFLKMSAAGNDFIVIAAGSLPAARFDPRFVQQVCRRRVSVGADGVILVEKKRSDLLGVAFYNPDGRETFCGNGARCAARYGAIREGMPAEMLLETLRGTLRAELLTDGVRLEIGACGVLRQDLSIPLGSRTIRGILIDVGVPHLVTFDLDPEEIDVVALGREIRNHPLTGPEGANVDFARQAGSGLLEVRTYERGVEDETLSCGTGCIAAALAAAVLGLGTSPTVCRTRSGANLRVAFHLAGERFEKVILEGEARVVYSGELVNEA